MAPTSGQVAAYAMNYHAEQNAREAQKSEPLPHPAEVKWAFNYYRCSDHELRSFVAARAGETTSMDRNDCIFALKDLDGAATLRFLDAEKVVQEESITTPGLPVEIRQRVYRELFESHKMSLNLQLVCRQMHAEVQDTIWTDHPLRLEIQLQHWESSKLRLFCLGQWHRLNYRYHSTSRLVREDAETLPRLMAHAPVLKRSKRCVIDISCSDQEDEYVSKYELKCRRKESRRLGLVVWVLASILAGGSCNSVDVVISGNYQVSNGYELGQTLWPLAVLGPNTRIQLPQGLEANFSDGKKALILWSGVEEEALNILSLSRRKYRHSPRANKLRDAIAVEQKTQVRFAASVPLSVRVESMQKVRRLSTRYRTRALRRRDQTGTAPSKTPLELEFARLLACDPARIVG